MKTINNLNSNVNFKLKGSESGTGVTIAPVDIDSNANNPEMGNFVRNDPIQLQPTSDDGDTLGKENADADIVELGSSSKKWMWIVIGIVVLAAAWWFFTKK